jgi:L-alanine-DL-glutamate epimerase-like enolase superfamily enzyme
MKIKSKSRVEGKFFKAKIVYASFELTETYHISFGDINSFETIFSIVEIDGKHGLGECTVLPGYDQHQAMEVFDFSRYILLNSRNLKIEQIWQSLKNCKSGFLRVSLSTALEDLSKSFFPKREIEVPVIELLNDQELQKLYQTFLKKQNMTEIFKVKVGRNVLKDKSRILSLIHWIEESGRKCLLRIDANGRFSYEEIREFLNNIPPSYIQFIEEPIKRKEWNQMARLKIEYPEFKFMLDESIDSIDSIEKVANLRSCDAVKLKLFKCGSIGDTFAYIKTAKKHGLDVILGNGVQNELGAIYEMAIYEDASLNDFYGEMIGPSKKNFILPVIKQKDGRMVFCPKEAEDYRKTLINL